MNVVNMRPAGVFNRYLLEDRWKAMRQVFEVGLLHGRTSEELFPTNACIGLSLFSGVVIDASEVRAYRCPAKVREGRGKIFRQVSNRRYEVNGDVCFPVNQAIEVGPNFRLVVDNTERR